MIFASCSSLPVLCSVILALGDVLAFFRLMFVQNHVGQIVGEYSQLSLFGIKRPAQFVGLSGLHHRHLL